MTDEPATPDRQRGFFESFDGLADLLRQPGGPGSRVPAGAPAAGTDAAAYRPVLRLPMALLHVVDDGREDGEVVRIRGDRLVIGRSEGDVVVGHDISMSPRHAAVERLASGGWQLADLGSSAGTFVRVTTARLRHGSTILIGRTRLAFEEADLTEAWFIETAPGGGGRRHECHAPAASIGRSGTDCTIRLDDPCVSPVHARVKRSPRGWRIDNHGANGLWVRIDGPVEMRAVAQFLCGEQRFVFEPLG
jgi:pSer/pThr/pTyr-binding forkhead associated (FHA) protein